MFNPSLFENPEALAKLASLNPLAEGAVAANVDADSVMLSAPEDATQVVIGFGLMLRDLAGGEVVDDLTGQAVDGAFDWEATLPDA